MGIGNWELEKLWGRGRGYGKESSIARDIWRWEKRTWFCRVCDLLFRGERVRKEFVYAWQQRWRDIPPREGSGVVRGRRRRRRKKKKI